MSKKLFVGGLSWGTTNESLGAAFAKFGAVKEAKVITDRETGKSKGFGFVTFEDDNAAQTAMEMNGKEIDGRAVRVDAATEKNR